MTTTANVAGRRGTSIAWLSLVFVLGTVVGCGDKPQPRREPDEITACAGIDDCAADETCVDGECLPAVCTLKEVSCSPSADAIVACSEDRLTLELKTCRLGQRCQVRDGVALCEPTSCRPGAWRCSEDGQVTELCSKDGTGIEERHECGANEVCDEGFCVPADSVPKSCEPGSLACDGDVVTECQDDAQTYAPTDLDCSAEDRACFEGRCHDIACEAEFQCREDGSYACRDNGTRWSLIEKCGPDAATFCSTATGRCEPYVCFPGTAVCEENSATRCRDDGSGPLPGGIACSDLEGCWDGACLPLLCTTHFVCQGRTLARCEKSGTELLPELACGPGTECDAELGDCAPVRCTPNEPVCRGVVATHCNADGIGYVPGGTDCSATEEACLDGACVPRVCSPLEAFCSESELRKCDETGAGFAVLDTCFDNETCDAELEACVVNECQPQTPLCVGTVLTECNDSGTGPKAGGTDCMVQGKVCDSSGCVPKVCEPTLNFCQSGHVFLCNDFGSNAAPLEVCDSPCVGTPGSAECGLGD